MTDERPLADLVDALRADHRRRWLGGDRVPIEDFFERNPRVCADSERALEFVYGEVLLREELGESPDWGDYARRFPALAERLSALLEVHRALESGCLLDLTDAESPGGRTAWDGDPLPTGPRPEVDGYEILGELGRGGMGVVYRARHVGLNRQVALKMILAGSHAGAAQTTRFRAEAEAIARLQHPNIVQIHEVGEQDGRAFFSLELVEGGSLAQLIGGMPQPAGRAAGWVRTLARAMESAHGKGIIHRDLKPSNILVASDGALKITDFGLAKLLGADARLTGTESIVGSPSYMAPEQALGGSKKVGPAADIYSLGVILYELLTGRPPFKAPDAIATLELVRAAEPVPPGRLHPGLSRDLETICLKCLEKEPERRYKTARELAEELERFLGNEPILARPIGRVERVLRWCRHRPALAAVSGLAALALVALAVVFIGYGFHQAHAARQLGAALDESRRLSASLTLERGLTLCEQGDVARGMLWLARSLEMAASTDDAGLQRIIRANLAGWARRLHPLRICLEHPGGIQAIAYSFDGGTIATGGNDGSARLWDAASGRLLVPPLAHPDAVTSVAFSPDGGLLLTVGKSGPAYLWRRANGERHAPALEHPGTILAARFSPDGRTVLTAGDDGTVRLWEARTGRGIGPTLRHREAVRTAAFGPDGRTILTGSDDHTAGLWDAASGRLLRSFLHDGPVHVAAYRPDGRIVVTGSEEMAMLRDVDTGQAVGPALRHDAGIVGAVFSPDGRRVLTTSRDWRARLWDTATGAPVGEPMRHHAGVTDATFSPDGRTLFTGSIDGTACLWSAATTRAIGAPLAHPGSVHAVAFSPDGHALLTSGSMAEAHVWEFREAPPESRAFRHQGWPNSMAFSPDLRRIGMGGDGPEARVFEVATGRTIGCPIRHDASVRVLRFGRDGKMIATGGDDRTVRLWDSASGRSIGPDLKADAQVYSLAFSPDGRRILAGTLSGSIDLWDVDSGRLLGERRHHREPVQDAAFSPDGATFLTGSSDRTARLWRTASLGPIGAPMRHLGQVWVVGFRPDGRVAATGGADRVVQLWDAATGAPLGPPIINQYAVEALAFAPDGRTIFIGSRDGGPSSSRLWDLTTREPMGPPLLHHGMVLAAAFDAAGTRIQAASEDRMSRTVDVPAPMEGDVDRIVLSVEVMTGMAIGLDGAARLLGTREWQERSRRLGPAGP